MVDARHRFLRGGPVFENRNGSMQIRQNSARSGGHCSLILNAIKPVAVAHESQQQRFAVLANTIETGWVIKVVRLFLLCTMSKTRAAQKHA